MMPAVSDLPPHTAPAAAAPTAAAAGPSPAAQPPAPALAPAHSEVPAFILTTRALAVGALVGLIVLGLAWELWLAPTGSGSLAIKVLPLLLPLPGLMRHRLYTYRWVSLLVWLYFTEGAVRAYDSSPGWGPKLALVQVLLCLVLFVACAAQVRWRLKHKTVAGEPPAPTLP